MAQHAFEYVDCIDAPAFSLPFASISSVYYGSRPNQLLPFARIGLFRGPRQAR